MGMKSIYEQRKITAEYRCTKAGKDKLSFEPVQRRYSFDDGRTTDLVDIGLDDKDGGGGGSLNLQPSG